MKIASKETLNFSDASLIVLPYYRRLEILIHIK